MENFNDNINNKNEIIQPKIMIKFGLATYWNIKT